jgi:hypothetical protein
MNAPGPAAHEEHEIIAAIEDRTRTFEELAERINRFPDPQRAFELATRLADTERTISGRRAADLRAQQVRRIWESEELTLTELGTRAGGVTKQRAKKWLQDAGVDDTTKAKEEQR